MIRVNLLPHREAARRARRQQFYALLGLVSILVGVIWFLGFTIINRQIDVQNGKNEFLKKELAVLDKDIAEIKRLKAQTDALLARKRVIEALQANRTETVHLFNELAKQVPEGIYLRSLTQTGQKIVLSGVAQSNARITTLMNNLDDSPLLENSTLIETKAEVINNRRLNSFSITTLITRQTTDASAASPPGRKK
ncbi:MAG: fimbrial protein [Betaproteobacteria bacterium HGW-Betaproteobacteria-11]|nr:MAG: fimbrial protein [Betaproteobacteria bacterium HGW-Betaproteobacteria-11]